MMAHPAVLAGLLLFGCVAILLLTVPTADVKETPGFTYGIVLDAGSSHTNLYIYKWLADKQNGTGVVTQHRECHVKGTSAQTRGGASHQILHFFSRSVFLLIISLQYGFVGQWFSPCRPTVGALDFGGASTQITFETSEDIEDKGDMMKLQLYGHEYSLYTHSFLCYGRDQVLKRLLAHILKSQGVSSTVTHPCYPAGHSRTVDVNDVFNSPCTVEHAASANGSRASVTVRGSGHYGHCVGNVSEVFSFHGCSFSQCSFDKVFQPNITGKFMAFSAFFYIHSFLQRITGITVNTPQQLQDATSKVCSMTFNEMLRLAPDQKSHLQDYCASSVFIQVLLLRGYGFDEMTFPRISFQKKAGDTSVGWALGYMLTLSSLLPAESVGLRKALTPAAWGTLLFLFAFLLTTVVVFIVLQARGRKNGGTESTI
ncbi:ectonucleoside triphosphate diphosphohydrolase 2 [Thalassophryne amazonica]|uniref:ectonucleoside triphosphate diphosphohydrolase 2 n=1 Tax=Thalassophryne amazonica TaxID=390379 RepID=UPI00147087F3|nr:ectonucleoside triphosphate diphosphohydrolase 2 [Thalassophryne amazonica]